MTADIRLKLQKEMEKIFKGIPELENVQYEQEMVYFTYKGQPFGISSDPRR